MSEPICFLNINQLMTMKPAAEKGGVRPTVADMGIVDDGALVIEDGKILYAGVRSELPQKFQSLKTQSLQGYNVFPGLIDCHTHLIFAGDRTGEFEKRNSGVSYQDIAKAGGGILSTVKATRKASFLDLKAAAQKHADHFLQQGVTTLEIKSGYGLDYETEKKMLEGAQGIKGPDVVSTFLGGHSLPPEFDDYQSYCDELKNVTKKLHQQSLCQRVDMFVEDGYFTAEQAFDYFSYAKSLGLDITVHVDQFNSIGGLDVALKLGAASVDHIVATSEDDINRLAQSSTVGVLLPVADFYLKISYPKARRLIDGGGSFAIGSDFNPGSSPSRNINFLGLLCRLKMQMTLPEVFCGLTVGGARALRVLDQVGSLELGKRANFFVSSTRWDEFFYGAETQFAKAVWVNGENQIPF